MTESYNKWLLFAEKDLATAEYLLNSQLHPMPYEIICFCAQQSAEKAIKALLIRQKPNIDPPQIHIIQDLLCEADVTESDYTEIYRAGNFLTPFATKGRYPAKIEITKETAEKAVRESQKVYGFVKAKIEE